MTLAEYKQRRIRTNKRKQTYGHYFLSWIDWLSARQLVQTSVYLLASPAIFTSISSTPFPWAGTATAPSFPFSRLPPSCTPLVLLGVQPSLQLLTVSEFTNQFLRRQPEVHKVAKTSTIAFTVLVLSAARFSKIRHRR